MSEIKRWTRVEVTDESGQVVAIESAMLTGRDIGEREREAITDSIRTLCGFIGLPDPVDGVQERDTLARRVTELEGFIAHRGYRRCDIPACNCTSFHGGHAEERLKEIEDVCLERVDWQGTLLKTVAAAIAAPPVRD